MFRQPKPIRKERILVSTGDIQDGLSLEISEYFSQPRFTDLMV
jgi:hypothetical protein